MLPPSVDQVTPPHSGLGRALADAARYRLHLRLLPVFRHEMLGPLSVLRMGLAVVHRQVQADKLDTERLKGRMAEWQRHAADASAAVADLRLLDRRDDDDASEIEPEASDRRMAFRRIAIQGLAQVGGHDVKWTAAGEAKLAAVASSMWALLAAAVAHACDTAPACSVVSVDGDGEAFVVRRVLAPHDGYRAEGRGAGLRPDDDQAIAIEHLKQLAADLHASVSLSEAPGWVVHVGTAHSRPIGNSPHAIVHVAG